MLYAARARLRYGVVGMLSVAIIIGVVGGAALAALAGARRTDSAYRRLEGASETADLSLGLPGIEPELVQRFLRGVLRLPDVARGDAILGFGTAARGADGSPDFDSRSVSVVVAPDRGPLFDDFERLKLEAGRLPRPGSQHEVVANPAAVEQLHYRVGTRIHAYLVALGPFLELTNRATSEGRAPTPEELAPLVTPVSFTVVGIGIAPEDILSGESTGEDAGVVASHAFAERHRGFAAFTRVYVDLHDPVRDLAAFTEGIRRSFPEAGVTLTTAATNAEVFDRSVSPYVRALQLFALVVIAAAVLVLGQAVARQVRADASDAPLLRALGMDRSAVVATAATRGAMSGIVGAVLAMVVAAAASPIFPLGLARTAEPRPGVSFDWLVLGLGGAVIAVVFGARSTIAAWARVRAERRVDQDPAVARSVSQKLAGAGVSPSMSLGVGWALRSGSRAGGASTWSVLPGLVAAVLALVAAVGFGASLDHLVSTPRLYGWNWDRTFDGFDTVPMPSAAELSANPDIASWAPGARGAVTLRGQPINVFAFGHGKGTIEPRVTEGRSPTADDEIALGERTLRALHRSVGDTVVGRSADGRPVRLHIVGRVVTPALSEGETVGVAEGATLTLAGLRQIDPGVETSFFAVDVAPSGGAGLERRYGHSFGMYGPQRPREIVSFDRVRPTPLVLAALLALLGVAALTHTLVLSVREGRHEIAVLKTLGLTGRQALTMIATYATTLSVLALAIGIPLGVAAGRWSWDLFVAPLGLEAGAVVPVGALFLIAVAGLALANLVAAVPARSASRTSPAIVLRSE